MLFRSAQLNQISAEYVGQFMDDKLTVSAGVRAPFFKRELNQYCYTANASTVTGVVAGSSVVCTSRTPSITNADGSVQFTQLSSAGVVSTLATKYIKPFSATKKYDAVLPNVGLTYELADHHVVYVAYAEGYGEFQLGREHYETMAEEHQQARCGDCSGCTVKCPNGVRVADRVARAQD